MHFGEVQIHSKPATRASDNWLWAGPLCLPLNVVAAEDVLQVSEVWLQLVGTAGGRGNPLAGGGKLERRQQESNVITQ